MSRNFNGTTQYFQINSIPYSFTEFAASVWFNISAVPLAGTTDIIFGYTTQGVLNERFSTQIRPTTGVARYGSNVGTNVFIETVNSVIPGTWQHLYMHTDSALNMKVVLDGDFVNQGLGVATGISSTVNNIQIGAVENLGSIVNFFNGKIAHFSIWDKALSDKEITSLSDGFSALRISPDKLLQAWELDGTLGSTLSEEGRRK